MEEKVGSEEEFINWKIVFNNLDGDFYRREAFPLPPPCPPLIKII